MEFISFRGNRTVQVGELPELAGHPVAVVLDEGRPATIRAIRIADEEEGRRLLEQLGRLAKVTALRRPLAARLESERILVIEEAPEGATLRTVRRLVPLTWEQASVLGEGMLAAVAALQAGEAVHGKIDWETAVLGLDARVRLTGADPMAFGRDPQGRTDLAAAAAIARELLRGASPASLRGIPEAVQQRLLGLVESPAVATGLASPVLGSWRRTVTQRLTPEGRARVQGQLQALAARLAPPSVVATVVSPGGPAGPPDVATSSPAPVAVDSLPVRASTSIPPAITRPSRAGISTGGLRRLAVGLLLLFVAGGGTALVLNRGAFSLPRSSSQSRATKPTPSNSAPNNSTPSSVPSSTVPVTPTPAAPAALRAIPLLAPADNSPVTAVQLTGDCQADGSQPCGFTITANLGSHPADTVDWQLDLVNRCSGAVTEVASGAIPAPAYYTYVQAQPQVVVPSSVPVGLVALAGAPGMAASAPMLLAPPEAVCGT